MLDSALFQKYLNQILLQLFFAFTLASCGSEAETKKPFLEVRTIAGLNREFGEPFGIAMKNGDAYISDGEHGKILKIGADGILTPFAEGFHTPSGIAFDENGDLFVADSGSHTIRKVTESGQVSTVAGIEHQSGKTDGVASSALFNAHVGIAISGGKIFVSDTYNDSIRVIENGLVSTLAGGGRGYADGIGASAKFDTPLGLAVWNGKVLVADLGNRRIRVVETDGNVWTLAGTGDEVMQDGLPHQAGFVKPTAIAINDGGAIFVADGNAIRAIGRRAFPFVETISDGSRGFSDGKPRSSRFNRPSGLAFDNAGNLLVADSDNQVVRVVATEEIGTIVTPEQIAKLRYSASEFRSLAPPRWPYDPSTAPRDIAGTLGEIRGKIGDEGTPRFHNGLDIAGAYGETAKFIRDEKVLDPLAAENFGTSRELLRMPTLGYIHLKLGRDKDDKPFTDPRFQFERDSDGKVVDVRLPRGARFSSGDAIGTLNSMNHVHLIAGRNGAEMNALDALSFPGITDSISPIIEDVTLRPANLSLSDPAKTETKNPDTRIKLTGKTRIVVRAYDRMDGNPERRKLGVYRLGYQILEHDAGVNWTISFDKMPPPEAVQFVYADGSISGPTGETIFNYIVTNELSGDAFRENFFDASALNSGNYVLRVFAADFFGNTASKDIKFEVIK